MIVEFPKFNPTWKPNFHRYYYCHFTYFENMLRAGNATIKPIVVQPHHFKAKTAFEVKINDKRVYIDFSDHLKTISEEHRSEFDCIFKFHYHDQHKEIENMYSFSPVNFHNWSIFNKLNNDPAYSYNPKSDLKILNNQAPGGAALERRRIVQQMLRKYFGNQFDTSRTSQESYFKKVKECLVSICVPGARNDMLDRGQGQYMFLGACTISPKLVSYVSWNRPLIANEHYIECKLDYSDLIEKIEWCKTNLDECKRIGENAKRLMMETSMPEKQIEWIEKCLT